MRLLALCCAAAGLTPVPLAQGSTLPQVTRLEQSIGPEAGGATVTIRGVGFGGSSPVTSVTFGGRRASFRIVSETEIEAVAPPGEGEAEVRLADARGESSPASTADIYGWAPPASAPWLGLNGNSSVFLKPTGEFVEHGIAYDRSGPIEWYAGETLSHGGASPGISGGQGLALSIDAGMIPVITIEYRAYEHCHYSEQCLPTSARDIDEYVTGFIGSAREIIARYPAAPILFEVSNEPWGYGSAAQYAAILAALLPAARAAGLPMDRIYAGLTSGGWLGGLYSAAPQLRSEVGGWYLHPYNPSHSATTGIGELPGLQAQLGSGRDNLMVSEFGFCAADVNRPHTNCANSPASASDSAEAAALLAAELRRAVPYHRAGWLRAVLVYSRNDGGWAMQTITGGLTAAGRAFVAFADANP